MACGETADAKAVFSRCLLTCLNIDLWRSYLSFIKRVRRSWAGAGEAGSAVGPTACSRGACRWEPWPAPLPARLPTALLASSHPASRPDQRGAGARGPARGAPGVRVQLGPAGPG